MVSVFKYVPMPPLLTTSMKLQNHASKTALITISRTTFSASVSCLEDAAPIIMQIILKGNAF